MKAMAIEQFGATNVFQLIEIPVPNLTQGHVLIRVKASSVNPLDWKIRAGHLPHLINSFPAVLHGDVAGVVAAVGAGVERFQEGDAVYGCIGGFLNMSGALAEYVVADANLIAHKPKTLSFLEAAALPLVVETAWEALVTYTRVQPGQTVLIYGGTGGVGHIAIQIAKWLGAKVFATASSLEKMTLVKQLGADEVINYKAEDVNSYVKTHTDNQGFDVVFDTVGGEHLFTAITAAAVYGKVVTILPFPKSDFFPVFNKALSLCAINQPLPLITGINRAHYGELLTKVAALVDNQQLKPLIDEEYSIQEVATAHARLESGAAIGKVVVAGF